jgi:hypothetical protein
MREYKSMSSRIAVLLFAFVLFLGCTSPATPKEAMLSSLNTASALQSLQSETLMNFTFYSGSSIAYAQAKITQYSKGSKTRSDMSITGIPELEGMDVRAYSNEGGSFVCAKEENWTCVELLSDQGQIPMHTFSQLSENGKKLIESGAISFLGNAEKSAVAGRECTVVSGTIEYEKAKVTLDSLPTNLKLASFSQCLDSETGVALSGKLVLEGETDLGERAASVSDMQVLSLQPNAPIDDAVFVLPASVAPT